MSRRAHWEHVYSSRPVDRLGWFAPRLETSLAWISELELGNDAPIIDVGAGASTLADNLLDRGHTSLTLLDLSATALARLRERLGPRAGDLTFIESDITAADLPAAAFALWHDRALFHFLTDAADRQRYRETLLGALRPAGYLIVGTFAPEAPPKCSGLPVRRYGLQDLANEFGDNFVVREHRRELHVTPGGVEQMYQYVLFQRQQIAAGTGS